MGRISETIKSLIIANVIFFIGTQLSGELMYKLFSLYYFESPNFHFWQPISHMFMHGGLMHILFNMYALWAFGSPVEYHLGSKKFLFFYFTAGIGAALIHTGYGFYQVHSISEQLIQAGWSLNDIQEIVQTGKYDTRMLNYISQADISSLYGVYNTPAVGASGAVYGVLVAFGVLYPNAELMLIFLPIPVKAKYFIPGLILIDLFFGISGSSTGIAHWAHIGGALIGFLMIRHWQRHRFDKNRWN